MNVAIARAQFEYQRKFSSIIYFGDGLWDAKTCAAMDIPLIGIDYHETGKLDGSHASHVFSDFTDIPGIYDVVYKIQAKHEK
jgi:phosphoglycolate phosphatase-like HAD superfamily hydrolase